MGSGAVWVCGRQWGGTFTLLFVVYLFSHKQRALVSIWLLSLVPNANEKERQKEGNEKERHLICSRVKNKLGPMIPGSSVVRMRQEMEFSEIKKEPKEMYFDYED